MAIQTINIGTSANKGDGDPLRTAFKKINDNFAELDVTNSNRDINGSVFADDSTLLVDAVNSLIPSSVLSGALPAIDGSALTGITATTLNGQNASYYLDYTNFTNTPTIFSGAYADLTGKPTIPTEYTDSDVDTHLNQSTAGAGEVLSWTGADYDWVAQSGGITDVVSDITPQLGGDLDLNSNNITGTGNINITGTLALGGNSISGVDNIAAGTLNNHTIPGGAPGTFALTANVVETETDPVVGAITGIVKADGAGNISAAVAGTDYLVTETITLATLKVEVAASADFADFQTRIAAL